MTLSLREFVTILFPLLIIMDPLGNLPFFVMFTKDHTPGEQAKIALVACASACLVLISFALTGDAVLRFFSVTLPAFQLAGGLIFFIYALQMLALIPSGLKTSEEEEQEGISKENAALVPLAIPLLAGPGSITAVLVWRQGPEEKLASLLLLIAAIVVACLIVFCIFYLGRWIFKFMGYAGIRVITRLSGLLLSVIAVQFVVNGLQQLRLTG
jgi:multiple antibiotic resistance protein